MCTTSPAPPWDWRSFPLWDPVRPSTLLSVLQPGCCRCPSTCLAVPWQCEGNHTLCLLVRERKFLDDGWDRGSNSTIHAVSTISILPCCTIPGVCNPSEWGSQQETDATGPGIICNDSNKGLLAKIQWESKGITKRNVYKKANNMGQRTEQLLEKQEARAITVTKKRQTDRPAAFSHMASLPYYPQGGSRENI